MAIAEMRRPGSLYFVVMVKSFLVWTFALTVCFLVAGLPLVVLMVTMGAFIAIALQAVLPMSAVVLVAGSLIGVNFLAILLGAAVLTFKGIHPHEVSWLRWLNGQANPRHTATYAACPLTCNLK